MMRANRGALGGDMRRSALILFLVIAACVARAQTIDLDQARVTVVTLHGPWHMQAGDDVAWAAPEFDDSNWPLFEAGKPKSDAATQTSGYVWYRTRVLAPRRSGSLSVFVPFLALDYRVYANGKLIGEVGGTPPGAEAVLAMNMLYPLPASEVQPGRPITLAIRAWFDPMTVKGMGGMQQPILIGDSALLGMWRTLQVHDQLWMMSDTQLLLLCNLLTAMAGLALFALRRREREYLYFGAAQTLWAAQGAIYLYTVTHPIPYRIVESVILCVMAGAQFLNLQFFVTLMRQRKGLIYWTAVAPQVLSVLALGPLFGGWLPVEVFLSADAVFLLVYGVCVPLLLYHGVRAGNWEARWLIGPFTLSFACNVLSGVLPLPALQETQWAQMVMEHFKAVVTWPFLISATNLAGILAMFSVVVVLVLRFVRSREDEERLASELAAARAVQHLLIPDEIPTVPGYRVDCVYRPAGEVGGDFFQILPLMGGGALVAIGDVSGKGMPAALTVSMLVGTLRAMAESTTSPASLLGAMNRLLMGRTSGGFATCLILHVSSYGLLTAANAGHIPPYVGTREMALESGLPLGMDGGAGYSEATLQLAPAQPVTLMTDGVAEARNADGELFGFERTAGLAEHSVADIAAAAQEFGQSDDITVLRLTRNPMEEERKVALGQPQWATVAAKAN